MGILKVAGKVLLIPLWFIISIIGVGVKLLVHVVAIAKKILGFGIMALFIVTVICYQDWLQAAFLACMGGVLLFILFAGEFIDNVIDLLREKNMCIDFRLKKMMIVEIVLVISDENRASPLGKGSIRKAKTGIYCLHYTSST